MFTVTAVFSLLISRCTKTKKRKSSWQTSNQLHHLPLVIVLMSEEFRLKAQVSSTLLLFLSNTKIEIIKTPKTSPGWSPILCGGDIWPALWGLCFQVFHFAAKFVFRVPFAGAGFETKTQNLFNYCIQTGRKRKAQLGRRNIFWSKWKSGEWDQDGGLYYLLTFLNWSSVWRSPLAGWGLGSSHLT